MYYMSCISGENIMGWRLNLSGARTRSRDGINLQILMHDVVHAEGNSRNIYFW